MPTTFKIVFESILFTHPVQAHQKHHVARPLKCLKFANLDTRERTPSSNESFALIMRVENWPTVKNSEIFL